MATMAGIVAGYPNLIAALDAAPGDREFVVHWVDEDERHAVSFEAFRSRARIQATVLHAAAVSSGDRVILVMPQGIAAMAAFVGAMMLGAVPAFLAYPNFKIEPSKYRAGLAGVSVNLHARAIVIDQHFPDDMLPYIALEDGATILRAREDIVTGEVSWPRLAGRANDVAFIQHSAGTTGLQKGVALTHAAVLRQIGHLAETLEIDGEHDRIYSWLPLYHDMGLVACFLLPMVCHVPVVMQSPLDWVMRPHWMLEAITEYHCTLSWMPNFAFQFIPRRTPRNRWNSYDLSSLRALINCSEPVRASSLHEFERAFSSCGLNKNALRSSYAMAENVFAITQSATDAVEIWADGPTFRKDQRVALVDADSEGALSFTSSGKALPGNEVRIVSDSGETLEARRIGEIQIRSDSLFNGYYNREDLTQSAFEDGWYRTGDLGFCCDGELFVIGRKKDLLIIGGENLYPQDIEEMVSSHPAIHDGRAVAMGIYNPELGTEEITIVAEVEMVDSLKNAIDLENEIRNLVVAGTGVAPRNLFLKPPMWIVKSTAGKPARSATRDKLFREHPELNREKSI